MANQNRDDLAPTAEPISTTPLVAEDDPEPARESRTLEEVKASYSLIIHELELDLGTQYLADLTTIKRRLEQSAQWPDLLEAANQLRQQLADFARRMMDERDDSARFIGEVLQRLGEVEAHLKASARSTAALHHQNQEFTSSMLGGLDQFRSQTQASESLSEIKKMVLRRLDQFKSALCDHRDLQQGHVTGVSNELEELRDRFRQAQDQLRQMAEENRSLSSRLRVDPLTGAHNRLALQERLEQEIGLMRRGQQVFSLLMVDIDHFKRINDTHGHTIGDKCLVEVVAKLKRGLRVSDTLARFGGEEFAVILPAAGQKAALAAADKLRRLVADTTFTVKDRQIPVTVSIGVSEAHPMDAIPLDIIARADEALYQAKQGGRNQVQAV